MTFRCAAISYRSKSTSLRVSYGTNFSYRSYPIGAHCSSPQGHSDLSQPAQRALAREGNSVVITRHFCDHSGLVDFRGIQESTLDGKA